MVLIPKGATDTRDIVLLETLWKVVEALIYTCLHASLQFHDALHGFRAGQGTGTAIMELKLVQELAIVDQDPFLLIFLDLRKAYGTVDRVLLILTFEGYGAGTRLCGLLDTFWSHQKVVPRQNGFHGPASPATR